MSFELSLKDKRRLVNEENEDSSKKKNSEKSEREGLTDKLTTSCNVPGEVLYSNFITHSIAMKAEKITY